MTLAVERSPDGSVRPSPHTALALTLAALAWIAIVAAVYYRQLWGLVAAGPEAWTLPDLGQGLRYQGLPHAGAAASRAAGAIGTAAAIAAAFLVAGRLADRWITPPHLTSAERLVVRFANGAGAWSFLFLALAGLGLYRPPIVRLCVVTGTIAAAVWAIRSGSRARERWTGRLRDRPGRRARPPRAGLRLDHVWRAAALLAIATAFACALAPEIEYDALWYHLELPRRWLAAGRPVDDVTEYISLYPLTWQLLFGAGLSFDGAQAAKLLHWTTLAAASVLAASIARRALGMRSAWLAAAVFVSAPTVLWEGTVAYVDLATAMHTGLGVGALWMTLREHDRRWLWLAGIQCGLACATKHLALVPVTIAVVLFAAHRGPRAGGVATFRTLAVLLALTAALASPWYVRSWLGSGNPFFPELYGVFGATPERWDHLTEDGLGRFRARFGGGRGVVQLLTLPWDMTMHGTKYGGTLGPSVLMLAPLVLLVWRRSTPSRWLSAGVAMYIAVWASPVSSFQLRFLVPLWILAAPMLAAAAESLLELSARAGRLAHAAAVSVLAAVLLTSLPPFLPLHEGDRAGWTGWLTHVIRRVPVEVIVGGVAPEEYLRREVRTYGAWRHLNEHAAPEARVLTFFGGDHFYARRARLWSEAVAARPVTWGATGVPPGELLRRLHTLSITHVMAPPVALRTAEQAALSVLQPATLGAGFDVEYEDYWVVVYRVRTAGSAAGATDQR